MTNQERRERRREAALKAAATRKAKSAAVPPPAEPFTGPPPARTDLVRRAQALGIKGEAAFWRRVHELRASHRPSEWTAGQIVALDAALTAWEAKRK
jgi:hypothetical protein